MSDALPFNAKIKKITPHRWSILATDLNIWHYITQDSVWLMGSHISALAHANPDNYIGNLERHLRKHGYSGGNLQLALVDLGEENSPAHLIYDASRLKTIEAIERTYVNSERKRWHKLISERVDDWLKRLKDLQTTVTTWVLESGEKELKVEAAEPCLMREELMSKYDVPDKKMPSFRVVKNKSQVALFRPKALWVIGANGRVDIVTHSGVPMLVDISEPLSQQTHWKLYPKGKSSPVDFTQEQFFNLISK